MVKDAPVAELEAHGRNVPISWNSFCITMEETCGQQIEEHEAKLVSDTWTGAWLRLQAGWYARIEEMHTTKPALMQMHAHLAVAQL